PIVQRQVAADAPLILRVNAGDPLPQAPVELTAPLEELDGLPGHEAAEGIADRKGSEHEEPVGGDAVQHVDLLAFEVSAQLHVVPPTGSRDGIRALISVLPGILRACKGIAERCIAAHDQIGSSLVQSESRLIAEAESAAGRVVRGLVFFKYIAKE